MFSTKLLLLVAPLLSTVWAQTPAPVSGYLLVAKGVDACDAGWVPIEDATECSDAAAVLGYSYDSSFEAKNCANSSGCAQYLGQRVCHYWGAGKAARYYDGHGGNAQWICKPDTSVAAPGTTPSPVTPPSGLVGSYFIEAKNVDACPAGFMPIYDAAMCATASATIGYTYDSSFEAKDCANSSGCVQYLGARVCHYAANVNGGVSRFYNGHGGGAQWICMPATPAPVTPAPVTPAGYLVVTKGVDQCDAGWVPIEDATECSTAAAALGYSYDASFESKNCASSSGCAQYLGQRVCHYWGSGSAARYYDGHGGNAQWICKPGTPAPQVGATPVPVAPIPSGVINSYFVEVKNVDACPAGFQPITDAATCATAAAAIGYTYDSSFEAQSCASNPNCAQYLGQRVCHYAANVNGGVSRFYDGHGGGAQWICMPSTPAPVTPAPVQSTGYLVVAKGVDACDAGWVPIEDATECSDAATALGYTYDSSFEAKNCASTSGCSQYLGQRVCHYWGSGKAARYYDGHGGNAQWICKPDTSVPAPGTTPSPVTPPSGLVGSYFIEAKNVDACPAGFMPIYDATMCATASAAIGYTYDSSFEAKDCATAPSCAQYLGQRVCHYAANVNGGISRFYNGHGGGAQWICMPATPAPVTPAPVMPSGYLVVVKGVDQCDAGWVPIEDATECATAAAVLGYTYDSSFEAKNCANVNNCAQYLGQRVCHYWGSGKAARYYDGHGGNAQWICKPGTPAPVAGPSTPTPVAPPGTVNSYFVEAKGVDACPSGFVPIEDAAKCATASAALGYTYDASYEAKNCATVNNCSQYLGQRVCHYAGNVQGGISRFYDGHGGGAQWICEPSMQYVIVAANIDACPAGSVPIEDAATCNDAATSMGYTYDSSFEAQNCATTKGCKKYLGQRVCHYAGNVNGGVARLYDGHGGGAQWICRTGTPNPTMAPTPAPVMPGGYLVMGGNVDRCDAGFIPVTTAGECLGASAVLGYTYDNSFETQNCGTTKGCKQYLGQRVCHYAANVNGGVSRFYDGHGGGAQWICKPGTPSPTIAGTTPTPTTAYPLTSYFIEAKNVDACPVGFSEITTAAECATAASILGYKYDASYESLNCANNSGCVQYLGARVCHFAGNVKGGIARFYDGHGGGAQWICSGSTPTNSPSAAPTYATISCKDINKLYKKTGTPQVHEDHCNNTVGCKAKVKTKKGVTKVKCKTAKIKALKCRDHQTEAACLAAGCTPTTKTKNGVTTMKRCSD